MKTTTTWQAAAPTHAGSKVFEHSVRIEAPAADVWKALSEGEELRRWFPIEARVKPGLGGSVFLSWGPACEGEAPITLWEPGRAIGWTETHDKDAPTGPVEIAAQWIIEPERGGGATVVKVVQSGFGKGAKWDDMYDSISNGWKFELRSLRHYLSRHKGEERGAVWKPVPAPMPVAQAWRKIAAAPPAGVLKRGTLDGYLEGDFFEFVGPDDRTYKGIVERSVPDKMFAGTIEGLDNALMRIEVERSGEAASMPCFWISIWGRHGRLAESIAAAWEGAMKKALGV